MYDFKVKSRKHYLNLFRVSKQPVKCVVFVFIEPHDNLICTARKLSYITVQWLKSECCGRTLTVFLVRTIEKYQIRIHNFPKSLIIFKIGEMFASCNLLIVFHDFLLFLTELLTDKNYGDVRLFGLPFKKGLDIALNNTFLIKKLLELSRVWIL